MELFSKKLFKERYPDLQDRIIPHLIESHSEQALRQCSRGMNSPLWTYWHMIRTEDVGVSRFIMDSDQEYPQWKEKVKAVTSLNGTGMSSQQVMQLSEQINFRGLKSYHEAVKTKTLKFLDHADDYDLMKTISPGCVERIICQEGTMPEAARDLLPLYQGKSKEWFLLHVCLTHPFYHLGQISSILKGINPK